MISRGRYQGVFLYELTNADLLLPLETTARYTSGNVVLFTDKKRLELGSELACAQDLSAAHEYLDNTLANTKSAGRTDSADNAELESLRNQIAGRDELLKDLADNLKSQRQTNDLLAAQLEQAKTQLAIEDASREELLGDLQRVSAETSSVEMTLERTITEKYELEQELASRITDLLEVNLRCDDLQQRIERSTLNTPTGDTNGESLTMASGKQIHIYHEFGGQTKRSPSKQAISFAAKLGRTVVVVMVAFVIIAIISIAATAQANSISAGEALNLLLGLLP